jgi:delta8-fatty-acid desaturase
LTNSSLLDALKMIPETPPQPRRKDAILSPRETKDLIANGRCIFILDNKMIKADAWLNFHPGGLKATQHMAGRDATDEVTAHVSYLGAHHHC